MSTDDPVLLCPRKKILKYREKLKVLWHKKLKLEKPSNVVNAPEILSNILKPDKSQTYTTTNEDYCQSDICLKDGLQSPERNQTGNANTFPKKSLEKLIRSSLKTICLTIQQDLDDIKISLNIQSGKQYFKIFKNWKTTQQDWKFLIDKWKKCHLQRKCTVNKHQLYGPELKIKEELLLQLPQPATNSFSFESHAAIPAFAHYGTKRDSTNTEKTIAFVKNNGAEEFDNEAYEPDDITQNISHVAFLNCEDPPSPASSVETIFLTCTSTNSAELLGSSDEFEPNEGTTENRQPISNRLGKITGITFLVIFLVGIMTYTLVLTVISHGQYIQFLQGQVFYKTRPSTIKIIVHGSNASLAPVQSVNDAQDVSVTVNLHDSSHWQVDSLNESGVIDKITSIYISGPFLLSELTNLLNLLPNLKHLHLSNVNDKLCAQDITTNDYIHTNTLNKLTLECFTVRCSHLISFLGLNLRFQNLNRLTILGGTICESNVKQVRNLLRNIRSTLTHIEIMKAHVDAELFTENSPGIMPKVESVVFSGLPHTNASYIYGKGFSLTFVGLKHAKSLNLPLHLEQAGPIFSCQNLKNLTFEIRVLNDDVIYLAETLAEKLQVLEECHIDLEFDACQSQTARSDYFHIENLNTVFQNKLPGRLLENLKVTSNCPLRK